MEIFKKQRIHKFKKNKKIKLFLKFKTIFIQKNTLEGIVIFSQENI
jgi:hypothetical protein